MQTSKVTFGSSRNNGNRAGAAIHGPLVKVDVVRVQIVADIRRFACPRFERLQLLLGLAHVRIDVREVANALNVHSKV